MKKYAVTFKYLVAPSASWSASGNLGRKNGFSTKKDADDWAKAQEKAGKIQPLKLIDCTDINCPVTVKEYKQKTPKKTQAKPKATAKKTTPAPKKSAPKKPTAKKSTAKPKAKPTAKKKTAPKRKK